MFLFQDDSMAVLEAWRDRLEARGVAMVVSGHKSARPMGVGHSKNQAVDQSSGEFLCFQDSVGSALHSLSDLLTFLQVTMWFLQDDIMLPQRVRLQFESCHLHPNSLIGSRISRLPQGSTERYTRWINSLTPDQLQTQVTRGGLQPSVPMWCMCVTVSGHSKVLLVKIKPRKVGIHNLKEPLIKTCIDPGNLFHEDVRKGNRSFDCKVEVLLTVGKLWEAVSLGASAPTFHMQQDLTTSDLQQEEAGYTDSFHSIILGWGVKQFHGLKHSCLN
uniref:Uncharacterized protein n=1 Tax=Oryzias sinensis TaxID=183150 RepID=A0A8C7Y775_9TELE